MLIMSIRHRGLRRLMDNDETGLPRAHIKKIKNILAFLQDMCSESELYDMGFWRPHKLGGDRKGVWSLHVSANWRILFSVGPMGTDVGNTENQVAIYDLDFEDYH